MLDHERYGPWLAAGSGFWGHCLRAFEASPAWASDPKHLPFKSVVADSLWDGLQGSLGHASAAVLDEFVMVNMVAAVCAGQATPEEATAEAARRARRYYRG